MNDLPSYLSPCLQALPYFHQRKAQDILPFPPINISSVVVIQSNTTGPTAIAPGALDQVSIARSQQLPPEVIVLGKLGQQATHGNNLTNAFPYCLSVLIVVNLSSFVQSRNTQNDERKRFLEPEVATLPRTTPRQPPLQRLGLGRLSGKCYTDRPTGLAEAGLIPIAVGGSSTAFSRRSVKTGGNRNASSGSTPSFFGLPIVHAA
jgi:hypothetical protein